MKRFLFLALAFTIFTLSNINGQGQSSTITTYAGPAFPADGAQATTQTIGVPQGVTADGSGGFYVASSTQNRIYHVSSVGVITFVAGSGFMGFAGDGGPAASAQFNYIHGIAADGAGNVFIADTNNHRIRKVSPDGTISTVAGTGVWGAAGDGGPAVSAQLAGPRGVAVDHAGNLFIADSDNNRIRKVTPAGVISTVAGNGKSGFGGDGGPATAGQFSYPVAVAPDANGNFFIADRYNHRIRMVSAAGIITTLTGGAPGFSGDGGPAASARIWDPRGVAVDTDGNVFIADTGNDRIRMINHAGIISTLAGGIPGFGGDGGAAHAALLALPIDLAVDDRGNLFIAERGNYRVRRINRDGIIDSVAGITEDGGTALSAQLNFPNTIASDGAGNLFIADTDSQRIRKISPSGVITTVAGNGAVGFTGDGGHAASAEFNYPAAVTADTAGNFYVADTRNHRIRKVTPSGIITTVTGNGSAGFSGDGRSAASAQLNSPRGVAVDRHGNLFIADTDNQRIRKVDASGVITTIAGNGTMAFAGDGGPAVHAALAVPDAVTVDGSGNVFIADSANHRVRKLTADGNIHTVAGNGTRGFAGDGGAAISAQLASPNGVAVDPAGNLFIADTENMRVRRVTPEGTIATLAGTGQYGVAGDGGPAMAAQLALPYSVAVDASSGANVVFIADTYNNRIRKTVAGSSGPVPGPDPSPGPVSTPFTIASRGGATLMTTANSASVQTGYARLQSNAGSTTPAGLVIFSFHPGSYLVSETGVPASAPLRAGRIYAEVNGPVNTGLAIANPNNQAATINFFFTDAAGNDLGSGATTVAPNQQIAKFLDTDPFKTFAGPSFQGTFSFTSDVPVGVVAIRGVLNERQDFLMSTLPVIDLSASPAQGAAVVPHFADGMGWTTQILLVNPGGAALSGSLEFRDANGATTNTMPYGIAPKSSQKLATSGTGAYGMTGSVRVLSSDGGGVPVPLVIFSYKPAGVTVSDAGVPTTSGPAFRVYAESSGAGRPGSISSGIAVANDSSAPASITFELTNLDGSTAGIPAPVTQTLAGYGHISRFVDELFPGLPASFRGILRVSTSSSGISVVGLRARYNELADFLITTTPPISEAEPAPAELVLPHLADGAGYTTRFILISRPSGQPSSGSLILFDNSGQSFPSTLR